MQETIKKFEKNQIKRAMPEIKPGDTVKVYQKIKEGDKERIQFFQGTVIKISNGYGMNGTFTVRKIASGVGVEKIFPFHLPTIVKLEILKRGSVRRAKLYYLRDQQQKKAKLKEKDISAEDLEKMGFDEVREKAAVEAKQKAEAEKKAAEGKNSEPKKDEKTATAKTQNQPKTQKIEDKDKKETVKKEEIKK